MCQKVLETIKYSSCPRKCKLQPCHFVLKTEHVYCCSIVTVRLKLILNNTSLHT